MAKTQSDGNNNCYCQDSELSWLQWDLNEEQKQMMEFVRGMIAVRKAEPVLRRQKFFLWAAPFEEKAESFLTLWLDQTLIGKTFTDDVWNSGFSKCVGLRLDSKLIGEVDDDGGMSHGDTCLILLNAHFEKLPFMLPTPAEGAYWEPLMDTAQFPRRLSNTPGGNEYVLHPRSMALLRLMTPTKKEAQTEGFVATDILVEAGMAEAPKIAT